MWLSFSKRRSSQRTQANHAKTNRLTYRPRLEALEDRTLLSPTLLYSYSAPSSEGWAVAVDSSGAAYIGGEGNIAGKLNPSGTAFTNLPLLSGGGGVSTAIALDGSGNIYVVGTPGPNFATTSNAFSSNPSGSNLFVSKLDPTGTNLLYSTYIPGAYSVVLGNGSGAPGIAVDGAGNIYVTGRATPAFIPTPNAFQPVYAGDPTLYDAFLAEFNPTLSGSASLVYGSFLGGGQGNGIYCDRGTSVAIDGSGNAYITGITGSPNFPVTSGALQTVIKGYEDTFVAKFNTSLSGAASLVYSTFLGGSGNFDGLSAGPGDVFPVGWQSFAGPGIAVDSSGSAYVTGETNSADFPTTPGAYDRTYFTTNPWGGDGYITKLDPTGSSLVYSTFLGGSGLDATTSVALDPYGNATVTGGTQSTDFPTLNPIEANNPGGYRNPSIFVTTLNASGSGLLFSTYLGAANNAGSGVALDAVGNIYVTGGGPTQSYPAYVYKISAAAGPSFSVTGFPSTMTAGTSGTITVTALNADGTVNAGYGGTVHFTSSDPQAVLPPNATLTNGTGTFTVTLKTAGAQSITATDTSNSNIAGSESGITVTPGAATHFLISGPASIKANTAFSITVTALDAYGNVATGYRGTIHFSDSVSGATLPGNYTFTASDNGVHTFAGLKLKTKGQQTITIFDVLNNTIQGTWLINVT